MEENKIKSAQKVWIGLVASLFVYAFVIYKIVVPVEGLEIPDNPQLRMNISFMATLAFIASCLLPAFLFSKQNKKPVADITLEDLVPSFILQMALNEAVGIFGLVLAFVLRNPTIHYPFLAVSILHGLFRFPASKERLISFYLRK